MENLIGRKFGRLEVKEFSHKNKWGAPYWKCLCDCGNEKTVRGSGLKDGTTQSCGCLNRERVKISNTIHGQSGSPAYESRESMMERCYSPNNSRYKDYGGRGITVCDRWLGKDGPINFLSDMGERPKGMTLDRIDNNGNYSPENCRWATPKEQGNNRRSNRLITYKGETKNVKEWSIATGINYATLINRLRRGWTEEEALTIPVDMPKRNRNYRGKRWGILPDK